MGQSIISRNNPAASGDKIGDIKFTQRELGDEWVKCDGSVVDPSVVSDKYVEMADGDVFVNGQFKTYTKNYNLLSQQMKDLYDQCTYCDDNRIFYVNTGSHVVSGFFYGKAYENTDQTECSMSSMLQLEIDGEIQSALLINEISNSDPNLLYGGVYESYYSAIYNIRYNDSTIAILMSDDLYTYGETQNDYQVINIRFFKINCDSKEVDIKSYNTMNTSITDGNESEICYESIISENLDGFLMVHCTAGLNGACYESSRLGYYSLCLYNGEFSHKRIADANDDDGQSTPVFGMDVTLVSAGSYCAFAYTDENFSSLKVYASNYDDVVHLVNQNGMPVPKAIDASIYGESYIVAYNRGCSIFESKITSDNGFEVLTNIVDEGEDFSSAIFDEKYVSSEELTSDISSNYLIKSNIYGNYIFSNKKIFKIKSIELACYLQFYITKSSDWTPDEECISDLDITLANNEYCENSRIIYFRNTKNLFAPSYPDLNDDNAYVKVK